MIDDRYEITTPPAVLPVLLADAKLWCNVYHTSDDTLLTSLLNAAIQKAELFTNRDFITRSYTGYFSGLDVSCYERGYFITLRKAPLQSVSAVEVMVDETLETVDTDDYDLKIQPEFSRIIFSTLSQSPDTVPFPYQVDFVAGYGVAVDVPEPIKIAIKSIVAYWYQNRGDCNAGGEIPKTAMGILREYRIINTFTG